MDNDSTIFTTNFAKLTKSQLGGVDIYGRTILHVVIVANRPDLLKQVLRSSEGKALLTTADYESGWTPFHYAVFYKRIACLDILRGATKEYDSMMKIKDRGMATPSQLWGNDYQDFCLVPRYINRDDTVCVVPRWEGDAVTKRKKYLVQWDGVHGGSHLLFQNQTLEVGDVFTGARFRQYSISKRFQAVVTTEGVLYDTMSRSGLVDQQWHQSLTGVHEAAISNRHIIALGDNGVYGWGLNSFNQLGFASAKTSKNFRDIYESTPQLISIKTSQTVLGVACSKIHSVVFTRNELWTFGLNIGQMGIAGSRMDIELAIGGKKYAGHLQKPVSLTLRDDIKCVATTELCTVVVTTKNDIHVYSGNQHFKLPRVPRPGLEVHFDLFKPGSLTKPVDITKVQVSESTIAAILTTSGDVYTFNPMDHLRPKYAPVWRARDHDMIAVDFTICEDGGVIVCTRNGSAFSKTKDQKKWTPIPCVRVAKVSGHLSRLGFIGTDPDPLAVELSANDFDRDLARLSPLASSSNANATGIEEKNNYVAGSTVPVTGDTDLWARDFNARYTSPVSIQPSQTVEEIPPGLIESDVSYLKSMMSDIESHHDWSIIVDGTSIGVHRSVISNRSPDFAKLLNLCTDEYFIDGQIRGYPKENATEITGTTLQAVLVYLHWVYSEHVLTPWNDSNDKELKSQIEYLQRLFPVRSLGDRGMTLADSGNFTIRTANGDISVDKYMLASRSSYFETLLSSRWHAPDAIDWTDVSLPVANIILNHVYGTRDHLVSTSDIDILFEVAELADEISLDALNRWAQYKVAMVVNEDNYLELLQHALIIGANVVTINCCWYIYHNLDYLFNKKSLKLTTNEFLQVEKWLRVFDGCKGSESSNFLEQNTYHLETFISDMAGFNELFISDARGCMAFEPIVEQPRKRRSSSRASKVSRAEVTKFRESVKAIVEEVPIPSLLESDLKKSSPKRSSQPLVVSKSPSPIPVTPKSAAPWAVSSVPTTQTPTPTPSATIVQPKKSKGKIGPMGKISQKQRKRLGSLESVQSAPSRDESNPWGSVGKSSPQRSLSMDYTQSMPVLGSSKPTLAEVMVEQSLKPEPQGPQKTLAEIQQEEEFARWWEQEARRVQRESQPPAPKKKRRPRPKPKSEGRMWQQPLHANP